MTEGVYDRNCRSLCRYVMFHHCASPMAGYSAKHTARCISCTEIYKMYGHVGIKFSTNVIILADPAFRDVPHLSKKTISVCSETFRNTPFSNPRRTARNVKDA